MKEQRARLQMSVTVRFTPAEADAIRATAERLGLTYSELVRRAVAAAVSPVTVTTGSSSVTLETTS
jgi:predicted DNA binding CopG/RHH family protein